MTMRIYVAERTLARWLCDDFAFMFGWIEHKYHGRPGCKVKEAGVLGEGLRSEPLFKSTTVWGMASLLTQVTVVPGTTVISPGMKCYGPCHGCHGPGAGIVRILARQGRRQNVTGVSLNARRTLCDLSRP